MENQLKITGFSLYTPRLELIPLNAIQFEAFRQSPEDSLAQLGILPIMLCTEDTMGNNFEHALQFFAAHLKSDPKNYLWHTTWHIVLKSENKRIGRFCFTGKPFGKQGHTKVGYAIDSKYQKKGYMTEALIAVTEWAFQYPILKFLLAETFPNNFASHRVLKKCGFSILERCTEDGNMLWIKKNGSLTKTVINNKN